MFLVDPVSHCEDIRKSRPIGAREINGSKKSMGAKVSVTFARSTRPWLCVDQLSSFVAHTGN